MSGHTPGPWVINHAQLDVGEGKLSIEAEDGYFIAQVDEGHAQNGNASLIAAAPELLEMAIFLEDALEDGHWQNTKAALRKLIAKATNQQGNNHD